ncbi:MAG: glycine cleavage system protein GcvH [Candidatus Omnitrophica bacterium]|nr:glycine cleavage system protein GcvH [Candidatus Omnitrophota bacterium]MDE2221882.1 glycine cleavage system protein GcvH [Candidatus Omnitrophota bacterium]
MEIEESFLYTKEHEWVSIEDNIATMGITDYAQGALGDVTYVELPEEETEVDQFEQFVSVESVKAASDIYAPISGKIVEVNRKLEENPSLVNKDCYGKGWIAKIEVRDMDESTNLMSADEYRSFLETLEH